MPFGGEKGGGCGTALILGPLDFLFFWDKKGVTFVTTHARAYFFFLFIYFIYFVLRSRLGQRARALADEKVLEMEWQSELLKEKILELKEVKLRFACWLSKRGLGLSGPDLGEGGCVGPIARCPTAVTKVEVVGVAPPSHISTRCRAICNRVWSSPRPIALPLHSRRREKTPPGTETTVWKRRWRH